MRCRGAKNRAAPFFPPTALRRTVPPQQGGARVFLTTVLPYWFSLGRRYGRDVVASMALGDVVDSISPHTWRVLGVESVCDGIHYVRPLRAWSSGRARRRAAGAASWASRRIAPRQGHARLVGYGAAHFLYEPHVSLVVSARGDKKILFYPEGRPLGIISRPASDPADSERLAATKKNDRGKYSGASRAQRDAHPPLDLPLRSR